MMDLSWRMVFGRRLRRYAMGGGFHCLVGRICIEAVAGTTVTVTRSDCRRDRGNP